MRADVDTPTRGWYRLRPFELATGLVLGTMPPAPHAVTRPERPRQVLERMLGDALRRPPCVIAFSGGRDSSAVLALAAHVARRDGLPLPVPVTRRFPGDPDAEESDWQTMVIRHLRIDDWLRLDVSGQCELIGPLAEPILRHHGLLWPPTVHVNVPVFEVAVGGTLVTGEGGDEVFGPRRVTPVLHLLRGGRHRWRGGLRHLPGAIGPAPIRRRHWQHLGSAVPRTWLRPHVEAALVAQIARARAREPLSWRVATTRAADGRGWVLGAATMQRLADGYDVQMRHPLLDPAFLRALAASGSRLGPMSRAEAMRRLFGDLLPPQVLRRQSKAYFNTALLGAASRAFARDWRGGGLDPRLVDEEPLRREWLQPVPHAGCFALLQAAWMTAQGWPLDGPS